MTQYVEPLQTNSASYTSKIDLTRDEQTLPPFRACDDLDKSIAILDEWVSSFIGRMQPYCGDSAVMAGLSVGDVPEQNHSGLERRIYASAEKVRSIVAALDQMNQGLHL